MQIINKRSALWLPAAALAALLHHPALAAGAPQVGEELAVVEMVWEKRAPEEVAKRGQALAEIMLGKPLAVELPGEPGKGGEPALGRWSRAFPEHPNLRLKYLPDHDELRIIDLDVLSNRDGGTDIGATGARELAGKYLAMLAERGLIDLRHYNLDKAQMGYGMVGEGNLDGTQASERIVEYRVTVRREINGIELANAGVRLSIHASGQLAGLRIGGVTPLTRTANGRELPVGQGRMVARKVSSQAIAERFRGRAQPPGTETQLHWQRLMYVMPEQAGRALVEPQEVYAYSQRSFADGVAAVASRRQIVAYSVLDPAARPVDFTAPTPVQEDAKGRRR